MLNVVPLGKYIIVDVIPENKITLTGLILVTKNKTLTWAKVLAVGDECDSVNVGDTVLCGVAGALKVKFQDEIKDCIPDVKVLIKIEYKG